MAKNSLRLDWCSQKAAKYACEKWHYSGTIPGKGMGSAKIGVWEDGSFRGCILYSKGATRNMGDPYGLHHTEVAELTRIALRSHKTEVSRMISISLKLLQDRYPRLRLIVSYADANQGHHGGIYQASNWVYVGEHSSTIGIRLFGELLHPRTISNTYPSCGVKWLRANVDPNAERVQGKPKFKYLYPLDDEMRQQIEPLGKPYPKL